MVLISLSILSKWLETIARHCRLYQKLNESLDSFKLVLPNKFSMFVSFAYISEDELLTTPFGEPIADLFFKSAWIRQPL